MLNRVSALEKSRDASEQYSRRNILRISGIPEPEPDENGDFPRENVDAVVMSVFKDIGSNVTVDEIDRAHRTGKPDPKGKPRAIIVKCVSFKAHQKAYTLRRNLNTQGRRGVFFNEDLTKESSDLLYCARKLVKSENIDAAWTSDGNVLIKATRGDISTIHRILDKDDLIPFQAYKARPKTSHS